MSRPLDIEALREAVYAFCECGGGAPGECCPACEVWHSLTGGEQEADSSWKHDCNALLVTGVELWVPRCPHCGRPRAAG